MTDSTRFDARWRVPTRPLRPDGGSNGGSRDDDKTGDDGGNDEPPDDGDDGDQREDGDVPGSDVSRTERVAMVASVLFTAFLFGFVTWHAVTGGGLPASPDASVTQVEEDVYRIGVANPTDTGLESITVVVHCGGPARTLVFENVPAAGHRQGTVVCPPDSGPPPVEVVQYVRP